MPTSLRVCILLLAGSTTAEAFGPEGHLIAGFVAEPLLCDGARAEIGAIDRAVRADLGDFAELGLWADRIRSDPDWRHSGPWHYMNIATTASSLAQAERAIRAYVHPPEGDVLWAIEHFSTRLADRSLAATTRADALRFVAHFVVDVHQPLHVGLASDRGGNEIEVRVGGTATNLHRFWDSDVIELGDSSPREYARELVVRTSRTDAKDDAVVWAAESLLLRRRVYSDLPSVGGELRADYRRDARALTDQRLADAGRRLAARLNRLLCP